MVGLDSSGSGEAFVLLFCGEALGLGDLVVFFGDPRRLGAGLGDFLTLLLSGVGDFLGLFESVSEDFLTLLGSGVGDFLVLLDRGGVIFLPGDVAGGRPGPGPPPGGGLPCHCFTLEAVSVEGRGVT